MAFNKKTWKDRVAEFINRRLLTKEDGSTDLVTVARSEGTISVEGDAFNAETMNDLEDRVEAAFNELNTNLVSATNITTSGKITWTSDTFFAAYGNQRLIKIGKLCFLHLCFAIKNTVSTGGVICGLPQGFTPKTNITNYAIIADSSRGPVAFNINSNGQVVIRTTVDSCNVELNCVYEAA